MIEQLHQIEQDLQHIKERNARVEADKAWETSVFRKASIALLTYIVVVIFFIFASIDRPFINAIVPTTGFVLSTFSMPVLKKYWIQKLYRK